MSALLDAVSNLFVLVARILRIWFPTMSDTAWSQAMFPYNSEENPDFSYSSAEKTANFYNAAGQPTSPLYNSAEYNGNSSYNAAGQNTRQNANSLYNPAGPDAGQNATSFYNPGGQDAGQDTNSLYNPADHNGESSYNAAGQNTGHTANSSYDSAGQPTSSLYDAAGQNTGHTANSSYDSAGQPTSSLYNAAGQNAGQNATSLYNPAGQDTNSYNLVGQNTGQDANSVYSPAEENGASYNPAGQDAGQIADSLYNPAGQYATSYNASGHNTGQNATSYNPVGQNTNSPYNSADLNATSSYNPPELNANSILFYPFQDENVPSLLSPAASSSSGVAADVTADVTTPPDKLDVEEWEISGACPIRVIRPFGCHQPLPALVWCSEVGSKSENIPTEQKALKRICNQLKCAIVYIAYHDEPYADPVEDAGMSYDWIFRSRSRLGLSGALILGGTGAGATLAFTIALRRASANKPLPTGVALAVPAPFKFATANILAEDTVDSPAQSLAKQPIHHGLPLPELTARNRSPNFLHVSDEDLRRLRLPPVFMLHGHKTTFDPQADKLCDQLRDTGHFVQTRSFYVSADMSSSLATLSFHMLEYLVVVAERSFSVDTFLFTGQRSWIQV